MAKSKRARRSVERKDAAPRSAHKRRAAKSGPSQSVLAEEEDELQIIESEGEAGEAKTGVGSDEEEEEELQMLEDD